MFILFLSFFGNEDLSLTISLSLSVPSILWCSVSLPPTYNEISRRMVTKSNCFIWMMHLGIYVLFSTVIVIGFYCVAHVNFLPYFLFLIHSIFTFSCFCIWTGSVSLLLTCIPSLTYLSHLCLVICSMWEFCDCFDWSLCCIWRLLIGWIFLLCFLFVTHSWSCEAPIFGCV